MTAHDAPISGLSRKLESLTVRRHEHVAEVTLTGTGPGNLMGPSFWRELPLVFGAIDDDANIRAVVFVGEGKHFSYGLDLAAMLPEWSYVLEGQARAGPRMRFLEQIRTLQTAVGSLADCRKPVVTAIGGWCVGGGMDVIAAADIRVAAADAKFSIRQTKLGVVPDLGSLQRLAAIIGDGHLRELALTGADIDAQRAERIGLVNTVHPNRDAALAAARALAQQIASNPPLVVQGVKEILEAERQTQLQPALRYLSVWNAAFLPSDDLDEAICAFEEGRDPTFQGS